MHLGPPIAKAREVSTFLVDSEDGREPVPRYQVTLGELPAGRWEVYLVELPWGHGHETTRFYTSAAEACARVDALYEVGAGAGVWQVRRWPGWDRPIEHGTQ
jgi:hypothetical protein